MEINLHRNRKTEHSLTRFHCLSLILLALISPFASYADVSPTIGCGQASAATLVQLLGKSADPMSADNPEGTLSLSNVKALVEKCGISLTGYKLTLPQVQSLKRPVIAVVKEDHAVVLDCISQGYVRLIDNGSPRLMRQADFEKEFTGVVLAPDSYSPPPLKVEQIIYLGALSPGQKSTWSLRAQNISTEPISFKLPINETGCQSCGSTTIEPRILTPSEHMVIDIPLSAPRQGLLEKHLPFILNTCHMVITSIVGEVNSGFVADPPSIELGQVPMGTDLSVKVSIRRDGGLVPTLKEVSPSVPWIVEKKELRKMVDTLLSMVFRISPAKAGPFREAITFKFTDDLKVVVPIKGEALSFVYAMPNTAVFGHVALGKSAEWVTELQGSLADRCVPNSPEMPHQISCAFSKESNHWKVRLVLTPDEAGLFSKEVIIRTGLPEQPELCIQALAFVKAADGDSTTAIGAHTSP